MDGIHRTSTYMNTKTIVWISTAFQAWHRWKDAPDDVSFLRDFHRHLFHVKVGVEVNHGDREVEFFTFKRRVEDYIHKVYADQPRLEVSCEMIAADLLKAFSAQEVTVSEDGENGATVTRS